MIETSGAVRAGGLVRTIGSIAFVGTDKAYSNKLTRIAPKAFRGLKYAAACTAGGLGVYLKSPVLARHLD